MLVLLMSRDRVIRPTAQVCIRTQQSHAAPAAELDLTAASCGHRIEPVHEADILQTVRSGFQIFMSFTPLRNLCVVESLVTERFVPSAISLIIVPCVSLFGIMTHEWSNNEVNVIILSI